MWVGLRGEREKEIDERRVYMNPGDVRVEEMERLFEVMQVDVVKSKVLML